MRLFEASRGRIVTAMSALETLTFRLTGAADIDAFRIADASVQTDFVYQQPGIARRTTARGTDGQWIVVTLWASAADADAAATAASHDTATQRWSAMVDGASTRRDVYELLD